MVEDRRIELLSDKSQIWVDDFGTGSSRLRRICDIAAGSSVDEKQGLLLSYFASRAGDRPIIEFGTSLGVGTYYMALGNRYTKIVTIEGSSSIAEVASRGFCRDGLMNIELIIGSFDQHLETITRNYSSPGLVFIDGNHKGVALKRYFDAFATIAGDETVIIADDIDYTTDMSRAWNEIKRDNRVTGSIDTGRTGILFFRRSDVALHYRIRY